MKKLLLFIYLVFGCGLSFGDERTPKLPQVVCESGSSLATASNSLNFKIKRILINNQSTDGRLPKVKLSDLVAEDNQVCVIVNKAE